MKEILIHHWDTDGICSAYLLMKILGSDMENMTPTIGNYFLTEEEIEKCRGFEKIYIADMALPEKNLRKLSGYADVTVFDHHIQKPISWIQYINPVAQGSEQSEYPSTTWILKEYFDLDVNLPVILGIVGDNEYKIKENVRFHDIVEDFCRRYSVNLDDLVRMVHLIDSNYKLGKKDEIEKLAHIIGDMSIQDILKNDRWSENLRILEREIENILDASTDILNDIKMIEMNTPYNIISEVTRKLAWDTGKNAVVVNRGYFPDRSQIYVRTHSIDLSNLIEILKRKGYNAGGKNVVMGAIVPKKDTDYVVEEILRFLGGKKSG